MKQSRLFWVAAAALAALVFPHGAAEAVTLHGANVTVEDTAVIRGQVLDAATGAPVPGAQVRLVELGRNELTHSDGSFHFTRLRAGHFTLIIERIGYRRETRAVELAPDSASEVKIALHFAAIQLPGLTATGSVGQRSSDQSFSATTVVAGQELARKLDATIAATLEKEPGLSSTSMGPATARPVIRGLGGDRILILEDGQRVGDLSAASPDHAVAVDPVTAKQIEVVRGPAALLYGSNALGGVVNVIREEIPTSLADQLHGSFSLQAQSENRGVSGGGTLLHSAGPLAFRLEGSARTAGELRTPLGILDNTGLHTYNLAAGSAWVGNQGHLGLAYRFYDSGYGIPGVAGDDHAGHDHADGVTIDMRRHTVRLGGLHRPAAGKLHSIEVDGSFNDYYHREVEADGDIGTEFNLRSSAGSVLARHGKVGLFSEGAFGVQGNWQDFATEGELIAPPTQSYALAGYLLEEIHFDALKLQFGGRYDWTRMVPGAVPAGADLGNVRTRTFGALSASVGALYDFGGGLSAGTNLGRAYRTPDVTELFAQGAHLATYSVELNNPDLKAETGLGADLFLRITRDRLKGEVAAYRNQMSNYIYPRKVDLPGEEGGEPVYQFVGNDAVLKGFEGKVEWSVAPRVVLDGTASYVQGTLSESGDALPFIPPLSGRLGVRYEAPKYFFSAGSKLASRQARLGFGEDETAGYDVYDAAFGVHWVALGRLHTVTLRGDNLTDTVYRDHLSRIKDIMPHAGRSVSLLYRVNF